MKKAACNPLAFVVTFIWFGFVSAISFMEAPVKFTAPSLTLAVGLDVGRHVFAVLNKVEIGFTLVSLWLLVQGGWPARVVPSGNDPARGVHPAFRRGIGNHPAAQAAVHARVTAPLARAGVARGPPGGPGAAADGSRRARRSADPTRASGPATPTSAPLDRSAAVVDRP